MLKYSFLLFLVFSGVTVNTYAAQPFVKKAESIVTETTDPQGKVKTVINTVFTFESLYDAKRKKHFDVLISRRIKSTSISGKEGTNSNIETTAWITGKEKFDTKLWSIKDSADDGNRWKDFYKTTKYGCCGTENIHRAFDIKTGKHAFSFTTDPVFVDIPNTQIKRDISYISVMATEGFEYRKKYPNGVGTLTISAGNSSIDRIIIETKNKDLELMWSPKLSLINDKELKGTSDLSLWQSNGVSTSEAVKAFSVKLFFYEGMKIIIPVNGDRFDIQKIVLPKSVSIRHISGEG